MRKIFISLICLISFNSQAQVIAQLPNDEVTTGLSIPALISNASGFEKNTEINLAGASGKYISVKSNDAHLLTSVSTRFRGIDRQVNIKVIKDKITILDYEHQLKFKAPAVVPDDVSEVKSTIGKTTMNFVRSGTDTEHRLSPGRFVVVVKNAASKKFYIDYLLIELDRAGTKNIIRVEGSPYWFEPLIVLEGTFETARVLEVKSK